MKTTLLGLLARATFLCALLLCTGQLFAQSPPPPPPPPPPPMSSVETDIYRVVEKMPLFPGCDSLMTAPYRELKNCADQRMLDYVYSNIEYPEAAVEEKVEGMAVISFIVERDGSLSSAKIYRNPGAGLGEEALRVVNKMNEDGLRWYPGTQGGRRVRVMFNLPIKFRM